MRRYHGLMIVALWQVAPNPIAVDSAGRIQGVLGFGAGQYERVLTSCAGDVLDTSLLKYTGVGAQVDAWAQDNLRFTGYTGTLVSDDADLDGPYFGGQLAFEWQHFGVGGGPLFAPDGSVIPNAFLRAGSRDRLHFRFDVAPPAAPFGMSGMVRLGLGYNQGLLRGPGLVGGLSLCHAACNSDQEAAGVFFEGRLPLAYRWDLDVRGLLAPGEDHTNTGLSIGGRFHLR